LSGGWISTAMTLFVVSLVLLVLILRDQRRAIVALETASEREALTTANATGAAGGASAAAAQDGHDDAPNAQAIPAAPAAHPAPVERGRIASLGGIGTLIWLVILVLMIWTPGPPLPGWRQPERGPPPAMPTRARAAPNMPARAGTVSGWCLPERRAEVFEQVVAGLDAHREADEVAWDLQLG